MARALTQDGGYTVVEMLVALALLSAVLLPVTQLVARLLKNTEARQMIVATNVARAALERATLTPVLLLDEDEKLVSGIAWRIVTEIDEEHGLLNIQVRVYRRSRVNPVVVLRTMRLADDY